MKNAKKGHVSYFRNKLYTFSILKNLIFISNLSSKMNTTTFLKTNYETCPKKQIKINLFALYKFYWGGYLSTILFL